jgi:hypothetical protein
MRIALVVGINYYQHGSPLFGCVDDAYAVKAVLERHDGGGVNFDCKLLSGTGPTDFVIEATSKIVLKSFLKKMLKCHYFILPVMVI